jgi:hypothetical protein
MKPIKERTKQALDVTIAHLEGVKIEAVKGLLNDVGMKYERQGATAAEILVVGKREDSAFADKHNELNALVQIIHTLDEKHLPPAQAGYILKKLLAIQQYYQPSEGMDEAEEA